jgi:fatty-acyl-CoA synthase
MTEPRTIAETLEARRTSPRGITFLDETGEKERWTFGDLGRVAHEMCGALRDHGIGEGDRVGILGSTSPDLVAAIFGCWASGAIAVPLAVPLRLTSIESLVDEITSRADKAGVSLLATDPAVGSLIPLDGIAPQTIGLDELRARGRHDAYADIDPDAPALIQFTSGSTARPKGVSLSHRTLISNGIAARDHLGFTPDDVCVSWLPLYHDFGLIGLTLWPLVLDMATHLIPPELFIGSPKRWVLAMSKYKATITAAPNFAYGLAARAIKQLAGEPLDLSPLRVAANGAEPVDRETMEQFAVAAAPVGFRPGALLGVYGLAEATLGVSSPPLLDPPPPWWVDTHKLAEEGVAESVGDGEGRALISVGKTIPGVEAAIKTPAGEGVPAGIVGEICIKTEHAMLGYWDDPDATAQTIVDGWIRTGDLGVIGPDGDLYITGRLKDMIIVGGRNLYPEDAERAAASVPGVRKGNAVAFGIVRKAKEGLVVIAETRLVGDEAAKLAKQISSEVRKALRVAADHVVLLVPGTLPKTPSGKLQRRLTRNLYEAGQFVSGAVASAGRALSGGSAEPAL